ncbi:MAG: response regulator [Nitrospirales bacterium]
MPIRSKKNARILLVDDDQAIRRSTRFILENEGYECREADGGVEALTLLDGGLHVDVIVTDLHMPVINGLNFMKALSYRANGRGIRVILMSGNLNVEIERQVLEGGAFAIFEKPLDYSQFLKALSLALEHDS